MDGIEKDVLRWVTMLPEVGGPILKEHEAIVALVREADEFENQARAKRGEAYRASLALSGRIGELWSDEEISEAQKRASGGVAG